MSSTCKPGDKVQMNPLPEGIYVAIVTPRYADETINHDEFANQVGRQIQAGIAVPPEVIDRIRFIPEEEGYAG